METQDAWRAGAEPGQYDDYAGAGIEKNSWEEGTEWLAQQGNLLLKFYNNKSSKSKGVS